MIHFSKFCTHCKGLGHDIHHCLKLSSLNQNAGSSKALKQVHSVPSQNRVHSKSDLTGKHPVTADFTAIENFTGTHPVNTDNNVVDLATAQVHQHAGNKEMISEAENLVMCIDHEDITKEGTNVDVAEVAAIQKNGDSSTLVLHNSFELLVADCELPSGEARLGDKDLTHLSNDRLSNITKNGELRNSLKLLDDEVAIPVGESHHKVVLSPLKMATPVTTYEELGPDKGKVHGIGGSESVSAAAKKSAQILSKFWGDVVDSDHTTDGTMDLDTDTEMMNMHPVALKFLVAQPDALHQPKSSRMSRKSSSSARGKGSDGITSSEHIQTRSKKGVIKKTIPNMLLNMC